MCPQPPANCYRLAQPHSDFQRTARGSILSGLCGKTRVKRLLIALLLVALAPPAAGQDLAEVNLLDALDEPRGYCIDMIGYKERARINRELQAHTCYSYQGAIAVDQGVDRKLARTGRFRLPHFDVCMTVKHARPTELIVLTECREILEQRFRLTRENRIVPVAREDLCVTVADGEGAPGGGGEPVHLRRSLSLQRCSDKAATRQRWRLR